jgi:hypothetical protein
MHQVCLIGHGQLLSMVHRNKLAIPYRQTIGRVRPGHLTGLAQDHQSQPKYPERMLLLTLQM